MDAKGWNVKQYTEHNGEQTKSAKKFFMFYADLLKDLYGDDPVTLIDVGSGCGRVLVNIILKDSELKFSKVVGADKCTKMIDHANKTYGSDELKFHLMDVQECVPECLKSLKFDILTSFYCLHWIHDLKKAFNVISSLLKPGGLFLCVFLKKHFLAGIYSALAQKYSPYMDNYENKFSELLFLDNADEVIKGYLTECGFEIVEFIDVKNDLCDLNSEAIMSESLEVINPFLSAMPDTLRKAFLQDQIEVSYKIQTGKKNPFVIKRRIFYFIAKKL
ncbi:unnamed protein product [Chironomus riparius]|uniref:Methyltransferase type 11 domain-containing protein n=1 Tax=Chironomus riparius TaxID=315576 RepID=A0A9N9RQJ6_9DIPT|nr:unnamed protein product [Chironomus riparius]